ncbi:hypothetical protein [Flavobacterium sp. 14A]|uniref:hypothetical protein n=1 Tax=Flavobacterium sp. 14A TaxID=2735896 RepID=UPI00156D882D|nr:hypothetical protein [Flavobacterium sp. 14A]NRT11501.1 putative RNase H-like nuclease (RuvC/YqgF family) [Flavobacterium sp. 14A]
MTNTAIIYRIELLEAKVENVKHSGHFTEKEIDSQIPALENEIATLQQQLNLYGMTVDQYKEGETLHRKYFIATPSPALLNTCNALGMNLNTRV